MTTQKQMTEKELDQVSGGTITVNAGHLRRFVTYTEHGSPFKVEIHSPKQRPVNSDDPVKVPWWRITR